LLSAIKIDFGGFAQLQSFYDTREIIGAYDDLFLAAPEDKELDAFGSDINNHPKFNMTALSSELQFKITGPDVNCFKTRAYIEFDFVGTATAGIDIGSANLRHAYAVLASDHHEILFGQTWHPIRPEYCTPHVVSYNAGSPVSAYALDPQLRYYYRTGSFEFLLAALEQGHIYQSEGPEGESPRYIHRAIVPNLHAQLNYVTTEHMVGVGIDYKRLVPRVVNDVGNTVDEQVNSVCATLHGSKKFSPCTVRAQFIYAQNISDMFSIAGYAVTDRNPLTDQRSYAPVQSINFWLDIDANTTKFVPGFFCGVVKNLGTTSKIHFFDAQGEPIVYSYIPNAAYVFRVSPRLVWNSNKFQVGLEAEYTGAAFGKLNNYANVPHGSYVGVFRALLALTYYF